MADRYFDLSIRMQNDAVQTDEDIAALLRQVADVLWNGGDGTRSNPTEPGRAPTIWDANGNRVGNWRVVDSRRSTEGYR